MARILLTALFLMFTTNSHPAFAEEIRLHCEIRKGFTGSNLFEAIITSDTMCMGDTTTAPNCARRDGFLTETEKNTKLIQKSLLVKTIIFLLSSQNGSGGWLSLIAGQA